MERRPCPICESDSENQYWYIKNGKHYTNYACPTHGLFAVERGTGTITWI